MCDEIAREKREMWRRDAMCSDLADTGVVLRLLDALDAADARVATLQAERDALQLRYDEECEIVARIWRMLGDPSYEDLGGRDIYDLINDALAAEVTLSMFVQVYEGQCTRGSCDGCPAHSKCLPIGQ